MSDPATTTTSAPANSGQNSSQPVPPGTKIIPDTGDPIPGVDTDAVATLLQGLSRPGPKTTEFKLSAVIVGFNALGALIGILPAGTAVKYAAITGIVYTVCRNAAKGLHALLMFAKQAGK